MSKFVPHKAQKAIVLYEWHVIAYLQMWNKKIIKLVPHIHVHSSTWSVSRLKSCCIHQGLSHTL